MRRLGLFIALVAASLASVLMLSQRYLQRFEVIEVQGATPGVELEVRRVLSPYLGQRLASLDCVSISKQVLQLPFIRDISLRRSFPNSISASVELLPPLLRARLEGREYVGNEKGLFIAADDLSGLNKMPLVLGLQPKGVGTEPDFASVCKAYLRYREVFPQDAVDIELEVGRQANAIVVRSRKDGLEVYLNRERPDLNLRDYLRFREKIHRAVSKIARIDLRWSGRIVAVPETKKHAGASEPAAE
jgi:cell division septal protein FtsQ